MRRIATVTVLLMLCACSGSPAGRFEARERPAAKSRTASKTTASAAPARDVAVPASLPPASMFLGPGSWRTAPDRYCDGGACRTLGAPRPPMLSGPAGAAVLFAVSQAPATARLEVTTPGSSTPTVVALTPGTSMIWQAALPSGSYPLRLVAGYGSTEIAWPFGVLVKQVKG